MPSSVSVPCATGSTCADCERETLSTRDAVSLVIDACLALSWLLPDETSGYADAALELVAREGALVPGNFHGEVAHALLTAERRGRIEAAMTSAAVWELNQLPIEVEPADPQMTLSLAREHGLTCHDGAYLALTLQTGGPLATTDERLRKAARALRLYASFRASQS